MDPIAMTKRFLLCVCGWRPHFDCEPFIVGGAPVDRGDAVEPEGFDSPSEAFQLASVFPGAGHGFVYDTEEKCVTHGIRWRSRGASN